MIRGDASFGGAFAADYLRNPARPPNPPAFPGAKIPRASRNPAEMTQRPQSLSPQRGVAALRCTKNSLEIPAGPLSSKDR
ncbi:hypothetical protein [Albimonas donghaensis]|uniref:hypothetical protein n=1 Tax=Albimonas donghaensis TaxID=356660 RepID=UPI00115FD2D9|nr:hypothetical protein [Albimonas donghaensis]